MSPSRTEPTNVATIPRSYSLILHSTRFRELAHHALLLVGELVGRFYFHLDDEIAALVSFLDSLPFDAKPFSRGSTGRDANQHLFPVERLDADLRAERCLRDVYRQRRDDVQSFALVEPVRRHRERDEEVAWRAVRGSFAPLALQPDLRPRVDTCGHRDENLLPRAHLAGAVARCTNL